MQLTKPIVFFDLETTGVRPESDRIVSFAANKFCHLDNPPEMFQAIVNPGVPIPPEASAVHGFSDDRVAGLPVFSHYAEKFLSFLAGADLAGYNLLNFDVPLLWEEFHRVGFTWDLEGVNILDVGNIFKLKEERTLAAAVRFYCGCEQYMAHDAMADVVATVEVLRGQLARYPDLANLSVQDLAAKSKFDDRVDLAGKIVRNAAGVPCYNFGKSKGVPVVDDPGFGYWMLGKDFTENTKAVLRNLLELATST